ncbi:TMEM175 family protein [uncultured Sphingomonas sp.]|uniref:TMEM175 family protein n=1 Tax=uncultured Sphingomonas sp. TaxID=158754 RepID=UPI0025D65ABE|nr:TMEM175 family protein [uncultured Sphingomonas sp.]
MITGDDQEHDRAQLERMAFFSDAVFAIAMTLLVVEVKLPHIARMEDELLARALLSLVPSYIGFLVSFLVLARFWVSHHLTLGEMRATSPTLVWANLFLLLAVAFTPFPTAIVAEYAQLRVGVGFYALWLILLGVLNQRIIRLALRHPELRRADASDTVLVPHLRASWIPVLIGGLAFTAGMIAPFAAVVVLAVGSPIITYVMRRRARA